MDDQVRKVQRSSEKRARNASNVLQDEPELTWCHPLPCLKVVLLYKGIREVQVGAVTPKEHQR